MGHLDSIIDTDSAEASAFVAALRDLREQAGNPSFRRMAQRSGCVSHTTLHEAATGSRFPSWETTREFVKACDTDPEPWLARWQRATRKQAEKRPLPRYRFALVISGIIIALIAGTIAVTRHTGHPTVAKTNVLTGKIPGDVSRFVADVTIPDGTTVRVNQRFQKVWQIKNIGTVTWHDRYLRRMDLPPGPNTCQTPDRVPIGDTSPGQTVSISVNVVAPGTPGTCWVGWKMTDANGHLLLPNYRPVYFLVKVVR